MGQTRYERGYGAVWKRRWGGGVVCGSPFSRGLCCCAPVLEAPDALRGLFSLGLSLPLPLSLVSPLSYRVCPCHTRTCTTASRLLSGNALLLRLAPDSPTKRHRS